MIAGDSVMVTEVGRGRMVRESVRTAEPAAGGTASNGSIGAALAMLLVSKGGKADTEPGKPIWVLCAGKQVEPFNVMKALAEGRLSAADWQRQCAELAIAGTDLGKMPSAAGEPGGADHDKS